MKRQKTIDYERLNRVKLYCRTARGAFHPKTQTNEKNKNPAASKKRRQCFL